MPTCECRPLGPARAIGAGKRTATTAGSLHNANFRIKHSVSPTLFANITVNSVSFRILGFIVGISSSAPVHFITRAPVSSLIHLHVSVIQVHLHLCERVISRVVLGFDSIAGLVKEHRAGGGWRAMRLVPNRAWAQALNQASGLDP